MNDDTYRMKLINNDNPEQKIQVRWEKRSTYYDEGDELLLQVSINNGENEWKLYYITDVRYVINNYGNDETIYFVDEIIEEEDDSTEEAEHYSNNLPGL